MTDIATAELISRLAALYPKTPQDEICPWSWIAATAFSASNVPEAVPVIFRHALKELETHDQRLLLARKFRDAIFKSGILSGYPKAINALIQLHGSMPEELKDAICLRDNSLSTQDLTKIGQSHFDNTYGDTANSVQSLLKEAYADLEAFCTTFAYGYVYAFPGVLSAAETSFAMVAALIATDVPRQIGWHLKGAVRNGASIEAVNAVRKISIEASKAAGVCWKNEVPEVDI